MRKKNKATVYKAERLLRVFLDPKLKLINYFDHQPIVCRWPTLFVVGPRHFIINPRSFVRNN